MDIVIDEGKLKALIKETVNEVDGFCCEAFFCAGKVDGKEIHVKVTSEEDEFMDSTRNHCVS